ncbi:MAG: hypothetical protein ABI448_03925 [Bacteroidia bacterium]
MYYFLKLVGSKFGRSVDYNGGLFVSIFADLAHRFSFLIASLNAEKAFQQKDLPCNP